MTIKDFKSTHFSIDLKTQFQSSKQTLNKRSGFIISMTDELGNIGIGECSPLPQFSKESIELASNNLNELKLRLSKVQVMPDLLAISNQFSAYDLTSSVHFAFEQAILSILISRNRNTNLLTENFGEVQPQINVNAVVGFDSTENILNKISEKIDSGYSTIKVKVGRPNFDDDFELIKQIRLKFGNSIFIRLDASGKWNIDTAKQYLNLLSEFNIQYIEEPCSGFSSLQNVANNSRIPIAVDESIRSITNAVSVINDSKIEFIVLKPMILGGIVSTLQLIKTAESKHKKIIISSSFESAVGKSALVLLAASSKHNLAHGLSTSELFVNDVCEDHFPVLNGKIKFDEHNYPPKFLLY